MEFSYPTELDQLASYFPKESPLYIVGGFVRDSIMQVEKFGDIDLASALTLLELTEILNDTLFTLSTASERLGTMLIKGIKTYEYTTFRIDSYPAQSGKHTPLQVVFCRDIILDAKRRDFKCNAIYYHISSHLIVDPLFGINDIENKILSTCASPTITLSQDGLRIMRLFRFVAQLDFSINPDTYNVACDECNKLADITPQRIANELDKLLNCKNCFNSLCLLRDSGALKIILPELATCNSISQNDQLQKFDSLTNTFWTTQFCPPSLRLVGLINGLSTQKCLDENICLDSLHRAKIAETILTRFKYSNKIISSIVRLINANVSATNSNTNNIYFVAKNFDILDDIIALKIAASKASGFDLENQSIKNLINTKQYIIQNNLPINIFQLNINGDDLIKLGYRGKKISQILENLLRLCLNQKIANEHTQLIETCKVY